MSTGTLTTSCTLTSNFGTQVSMAAAKSTSVSFFSHRSLIPSLKTFRKLGFAARAVYKVKLITPEGDEHEFEAPDDTYRVAFRQVLHKLSCVIVAAYLVIAMLICSCLTAP